MVATATLPAPVGEPQKLEKKPIKFSNLVLGAGLNLFEVTTLGQPLEVVKTTMAANRGDGFTTALGRIWARGGALGCTCFISLKSPPFFCSLNPRQLGFSHHAHRFHVLTCTFSARHSLSRSHPLGLD